MTKNEISRTDKLAMERTKLANERTFLAYFRTFVVLLGSSIAILKIELLNNLSMLAYFFIGAACVILLTGIARFFYVKAKIKTFYKKSD